MRKGNFQGYGINSKYNFQGLIKNKVEFPGMIKKSCGFSEGVDFWPSGIESGKQKITADYCMLFNSPMRDGCQIWQQNYNSQIRDLQKIQNKAVNIHKFERNSPNLSKLFNGLGIMKFKDKVTLNNCVFVHEQTNKNLPDALETTFVKRKTNTKHNHKTRGAQNILLDQPIKNHSHKKWKDKHGLYC